MTQIKKLPSVLAFSRAHFITDGAFYSLTNEGIEKPILVKAQGIRGTQNVSEKNGNEESKTETTNLQKIDVAKTDLDTKEVIVRFSLGFLDISKTLHSCNGKDMNEVMAFRKSLKDFLFRAKSSGTVDHIAKRYARNVLNGRWLWRNKEIAKQILININYNGNTSFIKDYDINLSSLIDFNSFNAEEEKLATVFAKQLKGEDISAVEITARLIPKASGVFEVYPSQNFQEADSDKNGQKKFLFKVNKDQAGLRDQKIFNAIKTIDDWYKHDYKEEIGPIPVEAYGTNINWNIFFRSDKKEKNNAFDLLKILNDFNDNNKMLESNALFILSLIERGGVFGESDKNNNNNSKKDTAQVDEEEGDA